MNQHTVLSLGNAVLDSLYKKLQSHFDEVVKVSAVMSDQGKLLVRTDALGVHYALTQPFDASTAVHAASGRLSKSVKASQHFSRSCAKELVDQILMTVGIQSLGYPKSQFKRVLVSIGPIRVDGRSHHFHRQKMSLVVQQHDETFWINTRCSVYFVDRTTCDIGPRSMVEPRLSWAQLAFLLSQQALKTLPTTFTLGQLLANPAADPIGGSVHIPISKKV